VVYGFAYRDKKLSVFVRFSCAATTMLLEHFGLHNESLKVHEAVDKAIELNVVTPDLNLYSKFGTNE
jgi:3-isopropylmalate dehydrogenase